ncbi:MAG: hypothetical protein OCC49_06670 [Fibrobacterales bacterium]
MKKHIFLYVFLILSNFVSAQEIDSLQITDSVNFIETSLDGSLVSVQLSEEGSVVLEGTSDQISLRLYPLYDNQTLNVIISGLKTSTHYFVYIGTEEVPMIVTTDEIGSFEYSITLDDSKLIIITESALD